MPEQRLAETIDHTMRPAGRSTATIRCPFCGCAEYGMPRVIVCDGSHYFDEDGFAALQVQHVEKVRERVRAINAVKHLMRKQSEAPAGDVWGAPGTSYNDETPF